MWVATICNVHIFPSTSGVGPVRAHAVPKLRPRAPTFCRDSSRIVIDCDYPVNVHCNCNKLYQDFCQFLCAFGFRVKIIISVIELPCALPTRDEGFSSRVL